MGDNSVFRGLPVVLPISPLFSSLAPPSPRQAFKLRFLSEHSDRLVRLADNKSLREEMTTFPLARGMDGGVRDEDRAGLLPLLVRQEGADGGRGGRGTFGLAPMQQCCSTWAR